MQAVLRFILRPFLEAAYWHFGMRIIVSQERAKGNDGGARAATVSSRGSQGGIGTLMISAPPQLSLSIES